MFSGNLDVPFLFLFVLSVFLFESWQDKCKHANLLLLATSVSLSFLWLTKTLIGFLILPVLLADYLLLSKTRRPPWSSLAKLISIAILFTLPWYVFNYLIEPRFLVHHFFNIGLRQNEFLFSLEALKNTLLYLRSGIGKWYYPVLISPFFLLALRLLDKNRRHSRWLDMIWVLIIITPFLLSANTQVWHLLPAYPPLFLLITDFIDDFIQFFAKKYSSVLILSLISGFVVISLKQFIDIIPLLKSSGSISEKEISLAAAAIESQVYFNSTFLPAFVYYSEQEFVDPLWLRPKAYAFMTKCLTIGCNAAFVVKKNDLDDLDRDLIEYNVLSNAGDYSIIQAKK
jgi:hypothetical protein